MKKHDETLSYLIIWMIEMKIKRGSKLIYKLFCFFGVHKRCIRDSKLISCIDCPWHKSWAEYQADLHAGGGW